MLSDVIDCDFLLSDVNEKAVKIYAIGGSSCYDDKNYCICDGLYFLNCDDDPCNYNCEVDSRTNIERCGKCDYDCREENPDKTPYYENEPHRAKAQGIF